MEKRSPGRVYAGLAAIVGWFALLLQFILLIQHRVVSVAESILRYFTYFTILTNIFAALTFTAIRIGGRSGWAKWFCSSSCVTAVTVYMLVVGVIYNTLLRSLVILTGPDLLVNELLHVILPFSLLLFWVLFVRPVQLKWTMAFLWLVYPFCYILQVMLVGALTGFYPYPFADAGRLGYPAAITNGGIILVGFFVLSLVFIGVGRLKFKSSH